MSDFMAGADVVLSALGLAKIVIDLAVPMKMQKRLLRPVVQMVIRWWMTK